MGLAQGDVRAHRPTAPSTDVDGEPGGRSQRGLRGLSRDGRPAATNKRACRPKERKLVVWPKLAGEVEAGLAKRWSPAEVSARLAVDFPSDPEMRVSAESIYCSLYLQGKGGLKKGLIRELSG